MLMCKLMLPKKLSVRDRNDFIAKFRFITLFGTKNRICPKMRLRNVGKADFERGKTDIFCVHTEYIGPITKIRIEHDNSGKAPGCKLLSSVFT
jgi:hypothetical protein